MSASLLMTALRYFRLASFLHLFILFSMKVILLAIMLLASTVEAKQSCDVSTQVEVKNFPKLINPTNNLRKKPGSAFFAKGQFVKITGRVLDKNCTPIPDVYIDFWQADSFGGFGKNKQDKYFIPTGQYRTNNSGEFVFFTVYPGSIGSKAPNIIYRVNKGERTGVLFFPDNASNTSDSTYNNINAYGKAAMMQYLNQDNEDLLYYYEIVLPTSQPLRSL
jgi:protocatechuate 3,4-dioxygenase beta subunit